jgi:hypothetical protein
MEHLTLTVDGLNADPQGGRAVERTLASEQGALRVYVSASLETVYVAYDPRRTTPAQLVAALTRAGLRVGEVKAAPSSSPQT